MESVECAPSVGAPIFPVSNLGDTNSRTSGLFPEDERPRGNRVGGVAGEDAFVVVPLALPVEALEAIGRGIATAGGSSVPAIEEVSFDALGDRWMTTKEAADYLGRSVSSIHKLTAARAIPFEQDAPGGKCWFLKSELDEWMRS